MWKNNRGVIFLKSREREGETALDCLRVKEQMVLAPCRVAGDTPATTPWLRCPHGVTIATCHGKAVSSCTKLAVLQ